MAVVLHRQPQVTVSTIADRNAITKRPNGLVVVVEDTTGDVNTLGGVGSYKWVESLQEWLLLSKSGNDTMTFETEELLIVNGMVTTSGVITGSKIWDISILNGDVAVAFPRVEDLVITSNTIANLRDFDGYKIRFTYGVSTVSQTLENYVNEQVQSLIGLAPETLDTFGEVASAISNIEDTLGTITDFEGSL